MSSLIWVTIHLFLTELWAFYKNIAHLAGASVSYGHISSFPNPSATGAKSLLFVGHFNFL